MNSNQSGTLYIVATPIGNLGDMVPRAIETLQSVSAIACEDTRHSKKLLDHFRIDKPLVAYHDHSDKTSSYKILKRLASGQDIALISDAGTPLISDPGYRLVLAAREQGFAVVPIPGACAAIAALSVAGLPTDKFRFIGFLPAKSSQRIKSFEQLKGVDETMVFYEAPHRILECLKDAIAVFGGAHIGFIAREITKTFETYLYGTLAELLVKVETDSNQQRGEIVLVLGASEITTTATSVDDERLLRLLLTELPAAKAAALAAKITGGDKKQFYQMALAQKG
ncbi:MAG: 16S rRNA (cytidine(1402)-2'-O)-methyltransferase [Porticoccaceae bacterium]|jgi:16S rRNA (cytidine1402-2'-O)-methyltransferase|nr:MAG: tetrapyrrole methylase [SAR92 bacterium BACL16 MAG-120619-bin48]KRP27320.1 MAG: tetrapyrrole methylase [SAR92 bacterium BACL16 MAG-120322-bin99]MDP4653932.1 16S rRNA (cytidine(1402)-2'-O)-methyltransferase [Alphaproteobacteria bacterium]MDP4743334.1 16S rRNA (cytidine(1402)-2'-O)-methyltransferase [Porticoccaceae bacterium]MDP4752192.1 16S rRNA (cytidine(1402)-2'-O)-methyltransferase [Porticoccaceae bacterium]|tara:strand:+ start:8590 stop:9435 length:846 start_codon:yes stop_codon:yes gene_type:complete